MSDQHANGSSGRFLRIEGKLDNLIDDFGDFRVEVTQRLTRLESHTAEVESFGSKRVSERSFKWMVTGIFLSFAVGALTLLVRVLGVV